MTLSEFLKRQGFIRPIIPRMSKIRNDDKLGNEQDKLSREIFLSRWSNDDAVRTSQEFGEELANIYYLKMTSYFRDSKTHLLGAFDLAPDTRSPRYGHNVKMDPRLYARKTVLENVYKALQRTVGGVLKVQVLVEDNHFHVHPIDKIHGHVTIPKSPVVLQLNQRHGYYRTNDDIKDDGSIFNGSKIKSMESNEIGNLPPFKVRT